MNVLASSSTCLACLRLQLRGIELLRAGRHVLARGSEHAIEPAMVLGVTVVVAVAVSRRRSVRQHNSMGVVVGAALVGAGGKGGLEDLR